MKRLVRELMIWRTLHHPNVVELHGWILELDEADKLTASFISTWCEGGDVKRYLQRNPDADRCRIICSAAEGVAYLHLRGIVHGDITPRNVVIDRDGLAKLWSSVVRSLRFIAPELLNVDDPVVHRDERSDVWAFGCTSAEILSDRPPYHGIHEFHVPSEIAGGTPPYIWDRPDEVGEVIVRCMTFQRDSRPGMLDVTRSFRRLGLVTGGSTLARSTCARRDHFYI
ncbi:kinase-like domain-containing protein [Cantharellus anzutake]|uniref:kinase-like domain-containing protein n=1 Tax=Cantharellus anzutake TaxID=1750568 RepID=UPI0019042E8E|nr:kinase-like domain-containing protein [Cantharellus anzutake]KAF8312183.1 kinase-like domain-containing protein [Cantharellus anzutake]